MLVAKATKGVYDNISKALRIEEIDWRQPSGSYEKKFLDVECFSSSNRKYKGIFQLIAVYGVGAEEGKKPTLEGGQYQWE